MSRSAALISALLLTTGIAFAHDVSAAGTPQALIVAGLGGGPDYESAFQRDAGRLAAALEGTGAGVILLQGEAAHAEAVQAALTGLRIRPGADGTLLFAFVGHGTWDGERFRFNVPGRDFTATDLRDWLASTPAAHQIVVVASASSGAARETLAADGRTLITATRSGEQRNATEFGRFFSAALVDGAADVDKDGRVSALEAFRYAVAGVTRHYEDAGEMVTEHPVLSGPEPILALAHLDDRPAPDAGAGLLLARRDELEQGIANLRANRNDYSVDDYFAELQRLLLEMAMLEQEIEAAQSAGRTSP